MENVAPAPKPEPNTRMAITEPEKPAARSTSFFGSLFSSKTERPAEPAAEKPAEKKPPLLSRMATAVGLRKPDPKEAASKPQTRVASHGAIKSKTAEATPPKPAEAKAEPQPAAAPAPAPVAAPTAMSGAAPVVPTGTFDGRWSGLR
jgi:hypothetical protein